MVGRLCSRTVGPQIRRAAIRPEQSHNVGAVSDEQVGLAGTWRTPLVILICGCLIGAIGYGPRAALGLFLTPMSSTYGWSRDVFALALAFQIIIWGTAQPFVGAIADRFGLMRVLVVGAVLYCAGLTLMAYSTTPLMLDLSAGAIAWHGCRGHFVHARDRRLRQIDAAGMALDLFRCRHGRRLVRPVPVFAAGGRLHPWVRLAACAGRLRHHRAVHRAAGGCTAHAADGRTVKPGAAIQQSLLQALAEAFGHRSYILLVLGFFTCGFQLLFVTVHLPSYLVDRGLSVDAGAWTLGAIGLFNIIGSVTAGWLGDRMPKRYLLSIIYLLRSVAVIVFISLPVTPISAMVFGAAIGLLWLSTVPPTSALVALMFGTRWMATLFGFAFFSHQVGGFLGVWLGGFLFERTGSYNVVWWLSVVLGIVSALINLPIVEKPVVRPAMAAA